MDLSLTDEQRDLRDAVRSLLTKQADSVAVRAAMDTRSGHDDRLWAQLTGELGLTVLALPESAGGADASFAEVAVVLEEVGAALLPVPYTSTVLVAEVLTRFGAPELLARLTEGAVGAVALAVVNNRFTWALLRQAMENTMRITAMVMFILIGATVFSLVFQGVDGSLWIEHLLSGLPGGQVGFLIFVNVFVFFLAFFLDFFEIAFIVIPLLAPVAAKLGIDLVWFGVLLCVNMQTSFMHPPFGFALFYLRGIAPKEVRSADIYWGAIPWVGLQLVLVAIVIFWPESVTYWLDKGSGVDPSTVRIEVPLPEMPEDDAPPVFR